VCVAARDQLTSAVGRCGCVDAVVGALRGAARAYQAEILPPGVPKLAVEAATSFGWSRWVDDVVAIDRFGASAPGPVALDKLGINPDHVAERARALLARSPEAAHDQLDRPTSRLRPESWYDNLTRPLITEGGLQALIDDDGIRVSRRTRPSFERRWAAATRTTTSSRACAAEGLTIEESYWRLVVHDVGHAADLLAPTYQATGGGDGFVSLEVSPDLPTTPTRPSSRPALLHGQVAHQNVMIKIPRPRKASRPSRRTSPRASTPTSP